MIKKKEKNMRNGRKNDEIAEELYNFLELNNYATYEEMEKYISESLKDCLSDKNSQGKILVNSLLKKLERNGSIITIRNQDSDGKFGRSFKKCLRPPIWKKKKEVV